MYEVYVCIMGWDEDEDDEDEDLHNLLDWMHHPIENIQMLVISKDTFTFYYKIILLNIFHSCHIFC